MNPERLRKLNKILFFIWIFPGIPVSIYLRNSIAWIVFLSVYAIIVTHLVEWRQEHQEAERRDSENDQGTTG